MRHLLITLSLGLLSSLALAQTPPPSDIPRSLPKSTIQKEEGAIPTQPSAPTQLWSETPIHSQRCRRTLLYRGEVLSCDSVIASDAAGLRPILDQTPEALSELEAYQKGRRDIRRLAYIGSSGLVLAFLGPTIARFIPDPAVQSTLSSILTYGGIGLTGGVVLFGGVTLRNNEKHLENAVKLYNQANPRDPVELQFSTTFAF
jgi:hypothetical protein